MVQDTCERCGQPRLRPNRPGRYCTKCSRAAYRERNRELENQRAREYYKVHREEKLKYCAEWRAKLGRAERNARARASYYKHREAALAKLKLYPQAKRRANMKLYYAKRPLVERAHNAVSSAIESGKLVRQLCAICGVKAQAHHDDYSKPLEVVWLCTRHHGAWHRLFVPEFPTPAPKKGE